MKLRLVVLLLMAVTICKAQPVYYWARTLGSSNDDVGYSIVTDASGNVYTTGYFNGMVDFDPGPGTQSLSSAGNDIFISKSDASGNLVWAKRMGGPGDDLARSIAVDASGNVYITGAFLGTADFDPGPGTYTLNATGTNKDIFICKLDASGNFVWANGIGASFDDVGFGIAVDAQGNACATGHFRGTVDFDPGAGTQNITASGLNDMFISKFSTSGNLLWAKHVGTYITWGQVLGYAIAVDAAGNIYTTGMFNDDADFDPGPVTQTLVNEWHLDAFVYKLDASGNYIWAKKLAGGSMETGHSIAVDASGNVYTAGSFRGTVDFDPGPGTQELTASGWANIFISKLDASGNFIWAKNVEGSDVEHASSLALDASGNVYTTGYFNSTVVDFDPGPGTQNINLWGNEDVFILKLDASGNYVWALRMGNGAYENAYSIAVDGNDRVYTTGFINGIADLDPGAGVQNFTTAGRMDVFISRLVPASALPLTLLELQAYNNDDAVQLKWQTSQEENTASFTVERSRDGKSFTAIGSVAAANTALKNNYTFSDAQPLTGTGFYRLKMIDIDGSFTYSHFISVRRNDNGAVVLLAPNPVKNILYVQANSNGPVTLQITDVNGRIVQQQHVTLNGNTSFSVNVQQLPAGKYYLSLKGNLTRQVQGFIKH